MKEKMISAAEKVCGGIRTGKEINRRKRDGGFAGKKAVLFLIGLCLLGVPAAGQSASEAGIALPAVKTESELFRIIGRRRSCRKFTKKSLTPAQISAVLWAAYGVKREKVDAVTAPTAHISSANAAYPLKFYLIVPADGVPGINRGIYAYNREKHRLETRENSRKAEKEIMNAVGRQSGLLSAPAFVVIGYDAQEPTGLVHYEAGLASQNIHLVCEYLGLGTVIYTHEVLPVLRAVDPRLNAAAVMPVGYPANARGKK